MFAVVCDGMGGLAKGELASATVIRHFSRWFDEDLPYELERLDPGFLDGDMQPIGEKMSLLLKDLNTKIMNYGKKINVSMGTTFTGALFVKDRYVAVHVGDSRLYRIGKDIKQLTTDQTFVAREVSRGNMTSEQAKTDKRRNMLLQCVGASDRVEPEIIYGEAKQGVYMLCSDGFRHEITEWEMCQSLNEDCLTDKDIMHANAKYLIEQVKMRREKDNISVILVKVDREGK